MLFHYHVWTGHNSVTAHWLTDWLTDWLTHWLTETRLSGSLGTVTHLPEHASRPKNKCDLQDYIGRFLSHSPSTWPLRLAGMCGIRTALAEHVTSIVHMIMSYARLFAEDASPLCQMTASYARSFDQTLAHRLTDWLKLRHKHELIHTLTDWKFVTQLTQLPMWPRTQFD